MTVKPISDERLAEIREDAQTCLECSILFDWPPADILALLARLDKAEAGWHDISTAPKDATVLVVSEPTERNKVFFGKRKPDVLAVYVDEDGFLPDSGNPSWRYTHWRPFPSPPTESA